MKCRIGPKNSKFISAAYGMIPRNEIRLGACFMSPLDAFTRHPAAVGETYGEHFGFATGVGSRMVLAGLACMLHGVFPFLFERTGSRAILALHQQVTSGARAKLNSAETAATIQATIVRSAYF
jgi:hypothetical protein